MNVEEKAKQQKVINGLISGVEFAVKQAVAAKDDFKAKFQDLNAHGTQVYSQYEVERRMNELKNVIAAKMQTANKDMAERLENIRTLIKERDAVLDLSNPAMGAALSLIQTIGSSLSYDEAMKINANFIHDQSALRALKAAYQAHDGASFGDIDSMIYDINSVIDNLKELAEDALIRDGSINFFASKFAKFSELEGVTTEKLPDLAGFDEAIRAGAGLK